MTERVGKRHRQRLETLLVRRATEKLQSDDERRLAQLLSECPDVDAQAYERAAAAVWLAATSQHEPMPEALRRKILEGADTAPVREPER